MELDEDRKEVAMEHPRHAPLNRATRCPFLMRVFIGCGYHNNMSEYRNKFPGEEVQIYTWLDATLLELMNLVKEVKPNFCRAGTLFDFALVFPIQGMDFAYRSRHIGATRSNEPSEADARTLSQSGFHIGDYMDIAVTVPDLRPRWLLYNPHFPEHASQMAALRAPPPRHPWECT